MAAVEEPPLATPELAAPTRASDWQRAGQPELHELPGGNTALLVRRSVIGMMSAGKIPNTLLDAAVAAVEGRTPDDLTELGAFLDFMVANAFHDPVCVYDREPGPGEIHVDWLGDADRNYVLIWVQRGAAGLDRFRAVGEGADRGGDGGSVRDQAE